MKEKISDYISRQTPVELLKKLISIDTRGPSGNEMDMIAFIIEYLQLGKSQYEIIRHNGNRGSMIFTIPGEEKGKIILMGHMDTVPSGDSTLWRTSPLSGKVSENRLYGSGASDMKSGLTVLLITAKYLMEYGGNKKNICFIFTADEECGCTGAKEIRKRKYTDDAQMILVAEPTDGNVATAEKGVMWIKIGGTGKQAHGAMPHLGINANECLWELISLLKKQLETAESLNQIGKATLSTTVFRGGEKSNIVPGKAMTVLDIRTVHKNDHDEIKKCLENIIGEMKEKRRFEAVYEIANEKYPLENSSESQQIRNLIDCSPEKSEIICIPYYTDLAELLKDKTLTFAVLGPGSIDQMHKTNEWVALDKINTVTEHYINYILNYC